MKRVSPSLLFASAALSFLLFPSTTAAAIFDFNGEAGFGAIVWDGDFDVGTSNSNCNNFTERCNSTQFQDLVDPLSVVLSGADPSLHIQKLFLVFSFPEGTIDDCVAFAHCGTLTTPGTLDQVFTNFAEPDNLFRIGDPLNPDRDWTGARDIVAFEVLTGQTVTDGVIFTATPAFIAGLGLPAAFLPEAWVGLALHFEEVDPADEFKLTIPVAATGAPEPASLLLVGFGLAGAVASRTRRRSKTARS